MLARALVVAAGALLAGTVMLVPVLAQRGAPPAPSPPDNGTCLACHGDPAAESSKGLKIGVDEAKFGASIHGALAMNCVDCHVDLAKTQDFPHAETLAKVDCATCHDASVAAYNTSIHAAARRQTTGSVAANCVDCHTSHEIRSAKDPESRTYPLNLPATCSACHGNAAVIAQGHIKAGNVSDLYKDSIHGRAVSRSGLLVAANCTSCHGGHDILPAADPASRVHRTNIPKVCGECHEGITTQYTSGVHGTALAAGNARAPVCADCHTAHDIQRSDVVSWRLDVIRECGTCHEDQIKTYRDTFHGQVTSLGFVRVATCASCHGSHAIFPQSDQRSMISAEQRLKTCQTCHPSATEGFAQYDPHADKHDRARNPQLYWASKFMTWLLVGVFGFFGLHALLWLPRGAIARRRRTAAPHDAPSPPPPAADGQAGS